MNLRRYALFFIVAVLTFAIGVAAAALVGGVNPLAHRHQTRRSCVRLTALPEHRTKMTVYTVYRSDGTVVKAYDVDKTYGLERLGAATDEDAIPPEGEATDTAKQPVRGRE